MKAMRRETEGQGHFQPQLHTCKSMKDGFIVHGWFSVLYVSTLALDPVCCKCDCSEKT